MSQTKRNSAIEAALNVLVGYWLAVVSQMLIFPLFGVEISVGANLLIGLWFTAISLVRSYVLRRIFNRFG